MLQKLDLGNPKVVAFRWEGDFTVKSFEQAMTKFLPELKARERMNVYLEVAKIGEFEAAAVWEDIKFGFKNMKELRDKIDRLALVTDEGWVRTLANTTYKFIPGIDMKTFAFANLQEARLFVQ
ncbi:STAS/SEC14 domain-containing protein [Antarcticibacterium flavum]|uniref:STAS/SEC14 domain-containing protein n=1 Tax=Antarcticibacterium flavum TaxID=2058175 RepID=A0A5B7X0I2_9FLAO|nr:MULTISPECIES: STAS/SEC14 domain-containing protein [Antarcticibacterium]MCM4158912.1 hypothetical protein [Antarcticibacterium sp. W02-3]QCY68168.1 STAS/SEC14 domain-containing protein [Antarcticibacterium flavum]